MKKTIKTLLIIILLIISSTKVYAEEALLTGLQEIDGKYYYYNEYGKLQKSKFINIDNKLYFFSYADGSMFKDGFFTKAGKTYYADTTTGEIYTGLNTINNANYYFDELGVMQKGLITIEGESYYFDNNGKMVKSKFITIDGKIYFFGYETGSLQKIGFFTKAGKTYYSDTITGEIATGTKEIEGNKYFFTEQGILQGSLVSKDGNQYYYNEKNIIQKSKFITIEGKLYFFGYETGAMQKIGFFTKAGNKYYADKETGEIATGIANINGVNYYFNEEGILQTGLVTVDDKSYYLNEYGKILKSKFIQIEDKLYFFGYEDGSMQKIGFFTKAGKTYYADKETGEIAIGKKQIEDKEYVFDSNGVLQYGWYSTSNETFYLDKNSGAVTIGNATIDGVEYQFNENGVWQSGWQTVNGEVSYIYLNGTKATGWVTIAGSKCYFNENGKLIQENALKIIDVSHHNGSIDWDTVKNTTDVDGAIVRLGYGTSYTTDAPVVDRYWDYNYDNTVSKNFLFGVYLYSYAIDEVSTNLEADFVLNYLRQKNYDKKRVVYYDLEENPWTTNLTMNDYDIIIRTFTTRLENEGYQVQLYSYKFWTENKLSDYAKSKLGWMAQYYSECTYNGSYYGWQYTADGSVNGINGVVDISVFKNI